MSKKNNEKKTGFHFGRNLGTILIVLIGLALVALLVYIPSTYLTAKSTSTPFESNVTDTMKQKVGLTADTYTTVISSTSTQTSSYKKSMRDDAKIMNGKDFNLFDFEFYATKYNQEYGKTKSDDKGLNYGRVDFYTSFKWNENTENICPSGSFDNLPVSSTSSSISSYNIYAYVCLAADWVKYDNKPFAQYSSYVNVTFTRKEKASTSTSTSTASTTTTTSTSTETAVKEYEKIVPTSQPYVSGISIFPYTASTWPFAVKKRCPDAYVYLYFIAKNASNVKHTYRYILKYTYDEYHTDATVGGIID